MIQDEWNAHIRSLVEPALEGTDSFVGTYFEGFSGRIFGGQTIAQALMAASLREDQGKVAHSLHACFIRPGDPGQRVVYQVIDHAVGRSFANRQVIAQQDGQPILIMLAGFHRAENGLSHQARMRTTMMPDMAVERLAAWRATADERGRLLTERLDGRPMEIVPIDPDALFGAQPQPPKSAWWMRMRQPVGAEAALQRGLLAYASDIMLLRNAMLPHGVRPFTQGVQTASLDHAIWFHDTPDMDDWLLFETDSPWAGGARGLSRGHFFTAAGKLVATVTQESLMRMPGRA